MDFGRLASVDGVDLTLPPDAPSTAAFLARRARPASEPFAFFTGLPVFANRDFVGRIYPKGTKPGDYLRAYANVYDALELNSTYYHLPALEVVERWVEATPPNFQFCPKVPEVVSHAIEPSEEHVTALHRVLEAFGDRLGPVLVQLPPSLAPVERPRVERLLALLGTRHRYAVELRHPGWFHDPRAIASTAAMLEAHQMGFVITDVAGRRDVLHMAVTAPFVLVRFAGNDLHPTDFTRLDAWAERISAWARAGLGSVHFFVHLPVEHQCADLVAHLEPKVRAKLGLGPKPKRIATKARGPQLGLFGDE
ncbi:DUF72 domain-containing protein [Myxococcota bacterium]|nr:DUF72 domain-containing protein [Myxococcota bacterium]